MTLPGFSWRHLGAFIANVDALYDWHLDQFAAVGGRYVMPVLYQLSLADDASCAANRAAIESLKVRCAKRGIRVGGWFNGWGGDPVADAYTVEAFARPHGLAPVVLDLETAYQLNTKQAALTLEVRKRFPVGTWPIGVSTNNLNDSAVFNGRIGPTPQASDKSFLDLMIRALPQWYDSYWEGPAAYSPWCDPTYAMRWVAANGMYDNWFDPDAPEGRACPQSLIKGTVEVTGLEGGKMKPTIDSMLNAQAEGLKLGQGLQLYLLERIPYGDLQDFALLASVRGKLYL